MNRPTRRQASLEAPVKHAKDRETRTKVGQQGFSLGGRSGSIRVWESIPTVSLTAASCGEWSRTVIEEESNWENVKPEAIASNGNERYDGNTVSDGPCAKVGASRRRAADIDEERSWQSVGTKVWTAAWCVGRWKLLKSKVLASKRGTGWFAKENECVQSEK